MFRSIVRLFLPPEVTDVSSAEAGMAGFDPSPESPHSPPVDTGEMPFISSAEAGLMVA